MLRTRVLQEWKNYKEKMINFKQVLVTLGVSTNTLPTFPIGLKSCRSKLDHWTSYDYQAKLKKVQKTISELVAPECIIELWLSCSSSFDMFKELTKGWKEEKDCNDIY